MKKNKILKILIFISVITWSSKSHAVHLIKSLSKTTANTELIYKSETREVIKLDSNNNPESKIDESTNYHVINFDANRITLYFKGEGKTEWSSQSFEYYSTKENGETIEFDTNSDISRKVYLERGSNTSIVYSFTSGIILNFDNLITIKKEDFEKLGFYKPESSIELKKSSNQIVIKEQIKDFEFSEYYRKESFKKAVDYLQQLMNNESPKCEIIRRGTYNPSQAQFIGNQGFRVKLYAEYDCNQDYVNESYFWVNAFYLGYGEWSLDLDDQKLTH